MARSQQPNDARLSRRDVLKTFGAIAGTAVASSLVPTAGRAAPGAPDFLPPNAAQSALGNGNLVQPYMTMLRQVVNNPNQPTPDQLYALTGTTRAGIPFGTAPGQSLTANNYVDAAAAGPPANPGPVGPTLTFTRGQTTGIWLQNQITGCGADTFLDPSNPDSHYTPHGYTVTNLHTHGLHVSPKTPSDNVLLSIASSNVHDPYHADYTGAFPFNYALPATHPVGTFWYHPHNHGGVAGQVATGMAGLLLVRSGAQDGDFDQLLAEQCNIQQTDERLLVLQTINHVPEAKTNDERLLFDPRLYYFGQQAVGCPDDVRKGDASSMAVNGVIAPMLTMRPGEIQRWRILNATTGTVFVPAFTVGTGINQPGRAARTPLPRVYAIATDGIALPPAFAGGFADTDPYYPIDYALNDPSTSAYLTTAELITIAPGQRVDLVVQAPGTPGTYTLVGAGTGDAPMVVQPDAGKSPDVLYTGLILSLTVSGDSRSDQSVPTYGLFKTATIKRPVSGLDSGTPPSLLPDLTSYRRMAFKSLYGTTGPLFQINDTYFEQGDPTTAQVHLKLDHTDFWYLYSLNDAHIFHIHVNPFQLLGRGTTDEGNQQVASPVLYQMPIWRDTLYFDSWPPANQYAAGRGVIAISRQVDFTGEFVLHCHNLFHEDSGMMLTVSVSA